MHSGCGGGASSVEPLVYYLYTVASYFLPFFPFIQHHNIIILLRNITVTLSFMVYLDNTPPKKTLGLPTNNQWCPKSYK